MIVVFYRVNTSNPDGSITTICSPALNMIAEVKDTGSVNSDGDDEAEYNVKIVPEYNGKVNSIIDITTSKKSEDRAYKHILTSSYGYKIMGINCDYKWFLDRFSGDIIKGRSFPLYMIVDGDKVSLQTYDHFWDGDPKFQNVFNDSMGGNHQWELYWCNTGGRSGNADITEVSANATTYPILISLWESDDYQNLVNFIYKNCKVRSPPEFNKKDAYLRERTIIHKENDVNDLETYVIQDLRSAIKRKDPAVWYQEYEEMDFDHPRPDYHDKKWKL